ncbi:MAG: ABC transporter permease [Bacteroidetes bacterium]|nr:MAG: ABC transporter permease [Bacteroidota bacterium]
MIRNFFTVAIRGLNRNKGYSILNIVGLAVGMAVSLLIGLWIYDELSFDSGFKNYKRIMRVMSNQDFNGTINTQFDLPFPLGEELRTKYAEDFDAIAMASWSYGHFLDIDENKKLSQEGMYVEPQFLDIVSVKFITGSKKAFDDPHSILLNRTLATIAFGDKDPIGKTMKIDNNSVVKVVGVFEDFPFNSSFYATQFLVPWKLYEMENEWVKNAVGRWGNFSFQAFAQLKSNADPKAVSRKIKYVIQKNYSNLETKPTLFLLPMTQWHLYGDFQNGVNSGGDIKFVWLFGIIGAFVLILACINFMNLSTARAGQRAKEVGVRKSIGSLRSQLVFQFLGESFLFVLIAFCISLLFVEISLGWFNNLTDKKISIPFNQILFWLPAFAFLVFTAFMAGIYPAIYLSAFNPVKILKGTFQPGRKASIPRKVLVVAQFTISMTLLIGTIIVYKQIIFAKNRPIGYDKNGLITTYGYPFADPANSPRQYEYLKAELMKTGSIVGMCKSSSPTFNLYSNQTDFDWQGHDPSVIPNFGIVWCSHDYGKTIGLQFLKGRDFNRDLPTDTAAILVNESAVKFMGLDDPINKIVVYNKNQPLRIIGVVRNMVMESPYAQARPTVFMLSYANSGIITMKLNPRISAHEAITRIEPVFKKFRPESLFEYQFADLEFAKKFYYEERVGKLAAVFSVLAIFVSCLGLFGLASFVAEQRTKEIGVRKVLGASVFQVWKMLTSEFVSLVIIASFIAIPIAAYFLNEWLNKYDYRINLAWWIFASAALITLIVTVATVSFQAIKAALTNPVNALRSE